MEAIAFVAQCLGLGAPSVDLKKLKWPCSRKDEIPGLVTGFCFWSFIHW